MQLQLTPQPFVRKKPSARARAEDRARVPGQASRQLGPLLYLFPGYLLLLVAAEMLTLRVAPLAPALGPILYGIILALLLLHAALCWDRPFRCLPLMLSLAPLARLVLFWPAALHFPGLVYCLALGLPLLAVVIAAVSLALPPRGSAAPVGEETRWVPVAPGEPQGLVKEASVAAGLDRRQEEASAETAPSREPGPFAVRRQINLAATRVPPRRDVARSPAIYLRVGVVLSSSGSAVKSFGQFVRAAWAGRRDWRVAQFLRAAWSGWRDWPAVQFMRAAWAGRPSLHRAIAMLVGKRGAVVSIRTGRSPRQRLRWLSWPARSAGRIEATAAARSYSTTARTFPTLVRPSGYKVLLRRWGRAVQEAVDPLAARVVAQVDGAWQDLSLRLPALVRALPRPDGVAWGGVVCAAVLVLLLTVRVGVSAVQVRTEAPGRAASLSAPRAVAFGGWGTGFLAGRSEAAMRLSPVVAEKPTAAVPTATAPAGLGSAAAGAALPTPVVVGEDRPPRIVPTPARLLSVAEATSAPAPVSAATFPAECPGGGYENIYPWGVCTWYAKAMRPDLPWFWGDWGMADNWGTSASACGFVVSAEPAPGAVIVFPPFANGASSRGHVGYVEEVGPSYVLFSECNASFDSYYAEDPRWWEGGYACIHRRVPREHLDPGIVYIHGRVDVEGEGEP